MSRTNILNILILVFALMPVVSVAHEIRPASLDISESSNGDLEFRWRQPIKGEYTISIAPQLSSGWLNRDPDQRIVTDNSLIHLWHVKEPDQPLAGQTLTIAGLDRTITDVLVTTTFANGKIFTGLIKASTPTLNIPSANAIGTSVPAYFVLGVEHIWSGIDHLVYVFALILLISNIRALMWTITAFTIAHSITLACAALGLVQLRSAPVEAVISLSIVYVAVELIKVKRGQKNLASKYPWLIAFTFGLLHGFGFAGALQEIGLPNNAVAVALLLFNLGIEIGQLIFVACVLIIFRLLKRFLPLSQNYVRQLSPYAIGSVASFWLIQRLLLI